MSQTAQFALWLVSKHISTRPRTCVKTKQNCLLVMLDPISLYLGTQFQCGLRKLWLCGIDTKVFTTHRTRSASVSKADEKDVPVHQIMAKAGWKSAEIFHKYYNKPVIQGNRLASAILNQWKLRNVSCILHVLFLLILLLLDHKLQTYLSLLMLNLLLLYGFHSSCLSACRMDASIL